MDRIGRQGLQLFVDAGCAVDNDLVSQLTQQVLLEKIQSMLGQRPDQDIVPLSTGATTVLQQQGEEEIEEELPDQVRHHHPNHHQNHDEYYHQYHHHHIGQN